MSTITLAQLKTIFPTTKTETLAKYVDPLNKTFIKFHINTQARIACFLGQIGIESANLSTTVENLNYSAEGLRKVFPKYFTESQAKAYARKPEKIASRCYANRMGNGNETSGDGWTYRGAGAIQITGKENQSNFAKFMELSLEDANKYLHTSEGAIISAGWFWASRNLNTLADSLSTKQITKIVNGGYNHLQERIDLTAKIYKIIK